MYKKLDLPNYGFSSRLDEFFSNIKKYKKFYSAIEGDYKSQNFNYNGSKCDLNVISPLDIGSYCSVEDPVGARINTLQNLYLSKTSYFADILSDMRDEHKLLSCPSCGEDGSPNTLDHYLPKTIYPELSVCIYNLIPMCSKCQNEKSAEYKNADNKKIFFHPYYEDFYEDMYTVEITPSPSFRTPVFSLKIINSIPSDVKIMAESHFVNLKLSKRFYDFVSQTYITIFNNLMKGGIDVDLFLDMCIDMHSEKGINNWNVILYKSIKMNRNLIKFILDSRT
ncbi:hypothetical protein F970_00311 [Acinetobacter sp. CIP 102082]|jgi:hypothetical protein|uniref:hypothetical protein n=1 Tax=Acinetobacter sp. CIP 102082 TaxID=1144663 RepID=UPI0002CD8D72|nr:hypothetical protein [Acinetobacter sp. CIP 102082]ENU96964.1 hypothetical protein F970_00311 [Acinetobacter sp. CIP 102082]